MNKYNAFKSIFVIALAAVLFSGCSKDDEIVSGGTVAYNSVDYKFSQGFIFDNGVISNTGGLIFNQTIEVVSSGITYDFTYGTMSGTGDRLILRFNSTQSKTPKVGTYSYNTSYNYIANTFESGAFYINYDTDEYNYDYGYNINGGTVEVAKNGDTYTISYNLITSNSKTIVGSYKGTLSYEDNTKK